GWNLLDDELDACLADASRGMWILDGERLNDASGGGRGKRRETGLMGACRFEAVEDFDRLITIGGKINLSFRTAQHSAATADQDDRGENRPSASTPHDHIHPQITRQSCFALRSPLLSDIVRPCRKA